jgi:hypothetical protein
MRIDNLRPIFAPIYPAGIANNRNVADTVKKNELATFFATPKVSSQNIDR